jgi:hypothetical protein
MNANQEMQQVKGLIAQVYARRETLKLELEAGAIAPRNGLARLEEIDRELSGLDSRFKQLWDSARGPLHPAANWARETVFEPAHLDCVRAIMLKILDAKCKMGRAEQTALAAVYDVVKDRPGQTLGDGIHELIAAARRQPDDQLRALIHQRRVQAEARIPKPVMKDFKQWLRAALPMQ